jgi:hypothetical protein
MKHRTASLALPALACLAALAAPVSALADDGQAPKIRPLAGALLTVGTGTKLQFTNPDGSVAQVDMAGVIDLYAGAEFPLAPNGLALQLTAGVHQTSSSAGASARRFPLEAILMYPMSDAVRLGGGIRYPMHLTFSGPAGTNPAQISATPGFLGTVEVKLTQHLALNMRYVEEQYQYSTSSSRLNASHFGIGVSAIY